MKHRVTIEIDNIDVDDINFQAWVADVANQWQADVLHESQGFVVQQFNNGLASALVTPEPLKQWLVDEYRKINQELADDWQAVGDLLAGREAMHQTEKCKIS
ncbi:MAG: hypothetical protein ACC707_10555 [Thiohalomonadales bacterium]